ncbi:MAG: LysM peptidoglycan-binding domain-containing protein [Bacteroidales bacterium]|nr:LysM peptidoglycan-binding domain-containing protein [Bacteroidales bacterium]
MRKLIILWFIISFVSIGFSQNDTLIINKSKDKVMIGNQLFYVHVVKKGETLFSLSFTYKVSQKAIAKENPEIFLGLKVGQALKIPVISKEEEGASFIYHKIKKKQTLYYLSKKYNVSQENILALNPTIRYGLREGQIVKIPKERLAIRDKFPTNNTNDTVQIQDDFIYHLVKRKETIYSLVRKYGISEEILFEHNPDVKEGLKISQVLKIPKLVSDSEETILLQPDFISNSQLKQKHVSYAYSDSVGFSDCVKLENNNERYDISLMLPLFLEKNDEEFYIDSSEYDLEGNKIYEKVFYSPYYIYPKAIKFIEFYEGFLLAVDSLKKEGLSINLNLYDTRNDTARIKEILQTPELINTDLIIGPIYNKGLSLVSQFSKDNNINIVSPLSDNLGLLNDNPNLFQVYPSFKSQLEEFAKYTSEFYDKNIVIVHDGDSLAYDKIQMVKERIFSHISVDTLINNIQFKEVVFKDSLNVLEHALDKENTNIFVIPSNNEAFVTDAVTKLNILKTFGTDIKVIGLSRWKKFNNIDPEYFFNLNLSLSAPFFIDYTDKDVKEFIIKYRNTFKTEPRQMAIHGYDVGLYFLSAIKNYGKDFSSCIVNYNIDLLQAKYHFVKWYKDSGYENIGVDIIKYQDGYRVSRINEKGENPESKY